MARITTETRNGMTGGKMVFLSSHLGQEGVPKAEWPAVEISVHRLSNLSSIRLTDDGWLEAMVNTGSMTKAKAEKVIAKVRDQFSEIIDHKVKVASSVK